MAVATPKVPVASVRVVHMEQKPTVMLAEEVTKAITFLAQVTHAEVHPKAPVVSLVNVQ